MKRIIAMFMVLCMFFSSNICYVQASEYEFVAISIIDGINSNKQEGKKYSVIRVDNDLMFSGEDLAEITGFEYEIKGQQVTFKRDYKEVKINLKNNKYTALKHLGNQSFENEVIYVNGKYYYPGAEILPWLNVLCFAKEDMLCIKRDEISYWDFGENFKGEMKGLQFDFVACCNELNVNSKWLKITSYVKDRGLGGTFQDILWIPGTASTVGGTLEYMDILEEMLADGDRVESACSELKKDMEVYQAGLDIVGLIDEIDDLPEDLKVAKKVSDVVPGLSMGVDMVMYTRLLKLDTTERLMWVETICRNRDYYDYPDALVGAALSISNIYDEEECFDDYFEKFMYSATDVVTGEFVDALTGKGLVKGMLSMFGLYSAVCPEWNEGINRIGKYNAIAKCSMEAYQEKIISTSIDGIESQRANAMLFLYATEHNWQVMADYAKDKGKSSYAKKYEKMAKEALRWQGKFLASSSSTVNDSHEFVKGEYLKEGYESKLRKIFDKLVSLEENIIPKPGETGDVHNSITEDEALDIAQEAIRRYNILMNIGVCCDGENFYPPENSEIYEYLNEELKPMFPDFYKCICCKSVSEAKEHAKKYVDESMIGELGDGRIVYDGSLYIVVGPKGFPYYDIETVSVEKYDESHLIVTCNYLNSGGQLMGIDKITMKKQGEYYVITEIRESKDFINQIENDIILSLLKETEVSVSGYKIMDLNGDGTEEIILSTRSEQNTQDSFYVIDKKSDTHIYEYTRFLAAGTNSLYVDEKNNDIYILQEYTTIGTQTQDIYKWNNGWEHIAHSEATEMNWHTFEWGQNIVSEEEWNAKLGEIKKCTKWKNNDISTNSLEFEFGVNELFEQYKNYLKENKLEYIAYEEDVDANGRAEKCIEIENYLWIYNKSVSSEFDTELPNVFTYGLYQPVTKIVLSGSDSSCKASVLLDKNRFSTKSKESEEKLKEYLVENIWYSYQPMLGDYYVYKFDKDGTFKLEMVDAYGVTEFYGERNYTVENGKVTLEEDGWSYIWEYNNGILNTTVYFKDDPMYGTYTLHKNLVPSKNEISIVNDKFRLYYNQIVAS